MKTTAVITFLVASGAMVSAYPSVPSEEELQDRVREIVASGKLQGVDEHSNNKRAPGDCISPTLCCPSLTTPVDPLLDTVLQPVGVSVSNIEGSIGLLCHPYDASCARPAQCCDQVNILGGTVALGCQNNR
ncbi:hydrophobin family protein [Aspergillus affinis]|uniref:hydrophobin family protein n=1 Tax=Aspergillus affinis TaxID=1070780 RepID=UPI0022FDEF73|nr:uncharacterized protein KD926_001375 [Aspergillus affinis]KAI9036741.1 hypothetical protein KD926_001375 [Aspergillus affinis]